MYREAGIPLKEIPKLLDVEETMASDILTNRLRHIQSEIRHLKKQEEMVLEFLKNEVLMINKVLFNNQTWTNLLLSLGFNEKELIHWHQEFDEDAPVEHEKFLKALGMNNQNIQMLRMKIKSL